MKKFTLALLLSAAFALPSAQALAWGQEGHRVTGYVAQQLLSPQAKAAVNQLIPNADFAQLALYMDQHKQELKQQLPGSDQWHYNDEPVCDGVEEDDCPSGNCASNQITRYSKVLADKSASKSARAQALTFLLHMIGDIHQPLHAADNHDRGGNDVKTRLAGSNKTGNLHSVWDTALVQQALSGANEQSWAAQNLKYYARNIAGWQSGQVNDWIKESNQYARSEVYGPLSNFSCGSAPSDVAYLDRTYQTAGAQLVKQQLVKAGARIAMVINQALQ
ncbi:S1/P1 nuclease [Chromobacterium sp. LK11]|uniref:S1/P1 nuclease n=2 Tax=Chromobacterium TaxID=535 RepID=UPI00069D147E|nr:S1/P1 nuclease [Chromobacterium sp. LK11]